jgi:hypothetical protein
MRLKDLTRGATLPRAQFGALIRECEGWFAIQRKLDLSLVTYRIRVSRDGSAITEDTLAFVNVLEDPIPLADLSSG